MNKTEIIVTAKDVVMFAVALICYFLNMMIIVRKKECLTRYPVTQRLMHTMNACFYSFVCFVVELFELKNFRRIRTLSYGLNYIGIRRCTQNIASGAKRNDIFEAVSKIVVNAQC